MHKVTVADLKEMAASEREAIWDAAKGLGREPKIYLHWTAGHYESVFDDYHVNILGDGTICLTGPLSEIKPHTWKRNTGAVGVALCCCAPPADTSDLGPEAPTAKQIEAMAQVITALADGLWLTIDKAHVMTHGEAAANEDGLRPHPGYACWNDEMGDGDLRWDLEYLGTPESPHYNPGATDGTRGGDVLRGKANWYRKEWAER